MGHHSKLGIGMSFINVTGSPLKSSLEDLLLHPYNFSQIKDLTLKEIRNEFILPKSIFYLKHWKLYNYANYWLNNFSPFDDGCSCLSIGERTFKTKRKFHVINSLLTTCQK